MTATASQCLKEKSKFKEKRILQLVKYRLKMSLF